MPRIFLFLLLLLGLGAGVYVWYTSNTKAPPPAPIEYNEQPTIPAEIVPTTPIKRPVLTTCQTDRSTRSRLMFSNRTVPFQYIAHTLGRTANGTAGTNTKEAFEHSYNKGFRLFEADFLETKDGHVIVAHDNHEGYWQLPTKFEDTMYADLKDAKFMGMYTTMDIYELLELMTQYPDTGVVIDIKFSDGEDYDNTLQKIITAGVEILGVEATFDRFIPQIYFPEDITRNPTICQFTDIMFTQYRNNLPWNEAYQFIASTPGITAVVTRYPERYTDTMKTALSKINKAIYVHPVQTSTMQDMFIQKGVGVFTSVSTTID